MRLLDDAGSPSLAKVASTIIRRINYPKALCGKQSLYAKETRKWKAGEATQGERNKSLNAKSRPLLSKDDEHEVFQTCALVLIGRGAFFSASLNLGDWKALFRVSRALLKIDAKREFQAIPEAFDLADARNSINSEIDLEKQAARREGFSKRIKYARACLVAARSVDLSRKAKSKFRTNRAILHGVTLGTFRPRDLTYNEASALSMALSRFEAYLATGEAELDRQANEEIARRQPAFRAPKWMPLAAF
ncbi:MAG: hypothetical protein V4819_16465 [Verrucomicrobiota bacterium]